MFFVICILIFSIIASETGLKSGVKIVRAMWSEMLDSRMPVREAFAFLYDNALSGSVGGEGVAVSWSEMSTASAADCTAYSQWCRPFMSSVGSFCVCVAIVPCVGAQDGLCVL